MTVVTIWNERVVERMRGWFDSGMTFSNISNRLNQEFGMSTTRSAVIGKVKRLQWKRAQRYRILQPSKLPRPKRPTVSLFRGARPAPPTEPVEQLPPRHVGFNTLRVNECRWPYGDDHPFTFCGCPTELDVPYCPAHMGEAHVPRKPSESSKTRYEWKR